MSHNIPPEPWHSFLTDVDALVPGEVYLYCLGGFVTDKAGKGSELCLKHKVYLDIVGVCDYPESYDERLTELFPDAYKNLRLFALEVHDLALAKLGRNSPRDREDIRFLAKMAPLEINILKERYTKELRPYLANEAREDLTMNLWIEMIQEDQAKSK
jgi:hypothetical protein